ncbi:AAA family ATPase [Odoribacter lunatus]|uniref:AAA family ATPase n=1 Tax=Odoribacter lunatus TaxID=2941335 RepID=UPI00203FF7E6|nr:ATP-binding protein [Odoribacter lunatus]
MKPNNPFLISGYYSPDYFCDREQETKTIVDALHNGRNITLIAPRRIGKTGLIKHVFHQLHKLQENTVTLYMDIYPTQTLGEFVRLLANTVLGQLDSVPQKALSRITQFIKSCRPVFTFDEVTGIPKVILEHLSPSAEEATLKEIFDYLKSSDKHCYIAIDEFQQITEYPEKGIEALLRSYIQFIPNVNFIFAGSQQHVMQEMFLFAKKPFYQSTQILSINPIDQEKYYQFANSFFEKQGRPLSPSIFDTLYTQFGGHTWYIQVILNRIYGYSGTIDTSMLRYAIEQIIAESAYTYENLLNAYPIGYTKLLKAIATEKCVKAINSGDFIAKYNLKAASSVNSALKKLIKNELIYKSPDGYIIYDRFMAEWLNKQVF